MNKHDAMFEMMQKFGPKRNDCIKVDETTRRINAARKHIKTFCKGDVVAYAKTTFKQGKPCRIDFYKLAVVDIRALYIVLTDGKVKYSFDIYDLSSKIARISKWGNEIENNVPNFKNLGLLRRKSIDIHKSIFEGKNKGVKRANN